MQKLVRRSLTIKEMAIFANVSPATVARHTSEPREEYLKRARTRHQKIKTLHDHGEHPKQIAQQLNVSLGTIYYALKKTA